MKRFLLSLFILINLPLLASSTSDLEDAYAAEQIEDMLKGVLVQHALSTLESSPSRAFEDFISVLPEYMHPRLKHALHAYDPPKADMWKGFFQDVAQNYHGTGGAGYMKMALIALEELFNNNLVFLIFQEGEFLQRANKSKQALHVLMPILPLNITLFLEQIRLIKPYDQVRFDEISRDIDALTSVQSTPFRGLDDLARALMHEKLEEKRHEHIYLHATNRLREMDHMGAIELFMQMLPASAGLAMKGLLSAKDLRIFTLGDMCENFYMTHKKDLLHIQDQALVKALESAEKFMILSLDPYYYTHV